MTPESPWIAVLTQGGAMGMISFVVYWVFSKAMPRSQKDFKDLLMAQAADAKEALMSQASAGEKVIANFLLEIQKSREMFAGEIHSERQHNEATTDRILQAIEHQNRLLIFIVGKLSGPLDATQQAILGFPGAA